MPKKYKIILFSSFLLILILGANFISASEDCAWKLPEIQYPSLPFSGTETPNQFLEKICRGEYLSEKALPLYVKYFYHLFLYFTGFLALGVIIWGGFQYLISAGAPGKMLAAREWISGGVSGLIILLSSYLILVTINPQLVVFSLEGLVDVELPEVEVPLVPEPGIPVYFQVPTGKIIENIVISDEGKRKMTMAKEAAEKARATAEELKNLTEDLKDLADACRCGSSQCSGPSECAGIDCPGARCDETAIEQKIADINDTINQLKADQNQVLAARTSLIYEYLELKKAGALTSLPYGVIDYNTSLILKYYQKINIDTFLGWEDIKIRFDGRTANDPLTFYFNKAGNEETIKIASALPYLTSPFPIGPGPYPIPGEPEQPPYQPPGSAPSDLLGTAQFVSERTGIRAAFILGLTKAESNWKLNPGVSYLINKNTICHCDFAPDWPEIVCNTLESIVRELGLNLAAINVSAPHPTAGCGGAMGIAQIMPFTWLGVKGRTSDMTGNYPPSPYSMVDGFAAAAIHLIDKYNWFQETGPLKSCETEKRLVLRYFGCNPDNLSRCPAPWYGERVVTIAEDIATNENLEHCTP